MPQKPEKIYGLGSVWSAMLGDNNKSLAVLIPKALNTTNYEIFQGKTIFTGLASFDDPLKTMTLLKPENNKNQVYSFYPFITDSTPIEIELTEIEEWGNEAEAEVRGNIENGPTISFFDALYFQNKDKYKIGEKYTFNLAAVIYSMTKRTEDLEIKADEGPAAGKTFSTSELTAYFPNDTNTEDFSFYLPFESWTEENIIFDKYKYHKLNFVMNHADGGHIMSFPMFINVQILGDYKPCKGDPIHGTGWLQGYLTESKSSKQN